MSEALANAPEATTPKQAASSLQELEDTVSRLASHKGVEAVMILSDKGEIIQSTGFSSEDEEETATTIKQAKIICQVKALCASLFATSETNENEEGAETAATDELSFIRIRSQLSEILVAPNNEYLLVVVHNPLISSIEKAI
jgi:dynein light chain roadblock-type